MKTQFDLRSRGWCILAILITLLLWGTKANAIDTSFNLTGTPGYWPTVVNPSSVIPGVNIKGMINDPFSSSIDNVFTQGSKVGGIIPTDWTWASPGSPPKGDLANVGYAIVPVSLTSVRLYVFFDRLTNNGDVTLGFWLFKNGSVAPLPDGSFTGTHADGDLYVVVSISNGGATIEVDPFVWDASTNTLKVDNVTLTKGIDWDVMSNSTPTAVPTGWPYTSGTYDSDTFFEGYVDLSKVSGEANPCFATSLITTVSSTSATAEMKDFLMASISTKPMVTTDTLSVCQGGSVQFTAHPVSNVGIPPFTYVWYINGTPVFQGANYPVTAQTLPLSTNFPGTFKVKLVSYGGNGCASDSATGVLTVYPPATANAGADQTVCSSSPAVTLAGSIGGAATSGTWSGGTGTFNPNASTLNAVYTPSAAEITAGTVTLTLTTNDPAGPCGAVSDNMVITINPAATVNAGADQTVCSSAPNVTLAGFVDGGASSGTWSGGTGTFNPNNTTLNAVYTPSAAEITAGTVTLTLTTNDPAGPCPAVSDQMVITINPAATVNAGADQTVCSSAPAVTLAGTFGGGASSATWSGGTGTFNPNASTLNAVYTPSAAEITAGTVTLTLTTNDPAGPCAAVSDNMVITINPAATANAGADQTVCSSAPNVTLAGSVGGGASSGTWSGGTGTFNPNANTLNAVYTPSAAEIVAGTVTLTLTTNDPAGPCPAVSDQMTITINPAATVNAGADQTVCSSAPNVTLAGFVDGGASSGTWSGGTGTFNPNANTLNAVYTPSAAEITAGTVTLTLTTNDPAGPCPAVSDQMTITINPAATVNAGADQSVCSSSPAVTLAGTIGGGASSATWSGGTGTFNPNNTTLNAVYTPSAAEIAAHTVTLTLTTNDPAGPCPAVSDQMVITIYPAATVNAGADQTVCSSAPAVTLAGTVGGGASSGTWSGGTGTFNPNAGTLNAVYTPSAAEILAGTVTLTLTTNDPTGSCGAVSDQMTITINPAATVNAGSDQTVCSSAPAVTLAGSVGGGASSGTWSGGTGTFNPNASTLNAVYTPSAAEITAGTVTLTLTTNDPAGPCPAVSDQMTITINPAATVNAGADQTVCSSAPNVTLAGSIGGGASSATWSGGTGTFNPNNTTLNAVYTPSAAEITAGTVTLTLTTNDPAGPCNAVSDQMTIMINPGATVNAGADQTVCSSAPAVTLAGSIGGGASSATWSGGTGTFNPNNTTLNAVYTPSAAEITAGTVTLTLTTNDPAGPCPAVSDQMTITINPAATVNAGADQTVCSSAPAVTLAGSIGGGASSATWSGGTGTFNPNANTLNAVYTPSAAEIAAHTVTLTLTTNDPAGPCNAVSDQMTITINPAATVYAGADQTVCSSAPAVTLAGTVGGGASSGTWSGGTGTFNPNNTTLNAVYTPSAAEILAGTVTLTLTTNDPAGPCGPVSDQMMITINPAATVNAGLDRSVCSDAPSVMLAGTVGGGASSGTWSGGTGTFNPNNTTLNAIYTPSAAEITAGTVTLTLTTNDPAGPCPAVSDQMTITINPTPVLITHNPAAVCSPYTVDLTDPAVRSGSTIPAGTVLSYWTNAAATIALSHPEAVGVTGTYYITALTSAGCADTAKVDVTIENCLSSYCSLTQGFYGNQKGKYCDGTNGYDLVMYLLSAAKGGDIVIGSGVRSFTINQGNAACVRSILPGGGTPAIIPLGGPWGCGNLGSIPGLLLTKQGRLNNVLLAQTITLALNLRLDPNLATVNIYNQNFYTRGASGCSVALSNFALGDPTTYTIPNAVWSYFTPPFTVMDIFKLASAALGGANTGVPLSTINSAVSMFNEAADECQYIFFPPALKSATATTDAPGIIPTESGNITVQVVPNPFKAFTEVQVLSPVSSNTARVDIYDVAGKLIASFVSDGLEAGVTKSFMISDSDLASSQSIFICVVRTDQGTVTKRIIRL